MQHSLRFLIVGFIVLFCFINESEGWWSSRRRRRRAPAPCSCTWTWGACSRTCGGGVRKQVKTNTCNNCNLKQETCNTNPCPIDCAWSTWAQWSGCSATCGSGRQSRTRSVSTAARFGGETCRGASSNSRTCNSNCCPVNCKWGEWSEFESCSMTCGTGSKTRKRDIQQEASCKGSPCSGLSEDIQTCNTDPCPIDCVWSKWGQWSECSATCGDAKQSRIRTESTAAQFGGVECEGGSSDSRECNDRCCPVDCVLHDWTSWTFCSVTCGDGLRFRARPIETPASCEGECRDRDRFESEPCNEACCPTDCELGQWSEWGSCSGRCGSGSQDRVISIITEATCKGKECVGPTTETQDCDENC